MRSEVVGASGVRIGVRVGGQRRAPAIVFVHGWAQSARVWDTQFADPELSRFHLLAPDLRGHGCSEVPEGGYDDPAAWADDLAAVLDLAGGDAVVVGWSYGGLVIADYLRTHGTRGLAGLVFVGAITEIGKGRPGGRVGPAMAGALPAALSDDVDVALPALTALGEGMAAQPVPGEVEQALLGTSLAVPPRVRRALFRRDIGSADVLSAVDVPALVLHGTDDAVVDVTAGEYTAGKIEGASTRWWSGVGHLPFVESAREFDTTLRGFAEQAFDDAEGNLGRAER
ncbi:putative hydrolase or acyltransferase of alpha/beta superfamily protein [Saccharomonospora azurea SZMC 14600]|uniref:alpha/beta fold hydrolase n=1 Tax=Saccharomonospora azurea TaxID=40988 RepID=UPI0002400DB2|nr:alpha/beta hydrolase [Saccharomonospora azurea]EHK86860.1 putative hydrolase or acyltransferase of alpha/beta superfamily protein [Saccharomonospora azurea SZMC 14600]